MNKIVKRKNGLYYTFFGKKYKIGGVLTYPKNTESLHTIITGTTGTGKTVLLTDLIQQIRNNGDRAIIYDKMGTFTSRFYQHETLKPLISTWMDISINTLLSLEQSRNRNIWIIIDELPSLNYLPSLHSGLAESRQFGGRFVLALQLPAQLKSIYGDRKAEATSGLCGTRIILRTPDEDTAAWCSNNLGKTEIEEVKQSISLGTNNLRDAVSLNKNTTIKSIVSSTEIMNLDNLNAYIKLAGDFPITKLQFKYKNYPKLAEKFIERKETPTVVKQNKIINTNNQITNTNINYTKQTENELNADEFDNL